jgi:hypothetical protein
MKHQTQKTLIVPILRNVAAQISPIVNSSLSDDDFYNSYCHIAKFIRTLRLNVDEFKIVEATIRMAAFSIMQDFGQKYAVEDIEEWLLLNSNNFNTGKGLAN